MQIYSFSKNIKRQANVAVNNAIRRGQLHPLDYCEICYYDIEMLAENETEENKTIMHNNKLYVNLIAAHHFNYNHPLEVWWLCQKCHSVLHALQRKLQLACIHIDGARALINENRDFYNKYIPDREPRYIQEEFF